MPSNLLDIVDPYACVDQQRHYAGTIELTKFQRLLTLIQSANGPVHAEIQFRREGRFPIADIRFHADLVLQCNACLQPIDWHIDQHSRLVMVNGLDEIELIPDSYEPWLIENKNASLVELIEDELLLEMPQVPKHEVCSIQLPPQRPQEAPDASEQNVEEKANPFDVLRTLKKD